MPQAQPSVYRNLILASLPQQDISRLGSHLSHGVYKHGMNLADPGEEVELAYFLEAGMASLVITMDNGTTVEAGIVGREGVVGMSALLGTKSMPTRTFMQIAGSGFSIKTKYLSEEFEKQGKLNKKLNHYLQANWIQTAYIAACNRVHNIAERLARWLLMCSDRMDSGTFDITHEFLAQMLGSPRSTVTMAAGVLQKAGLIDYSRGRVHIPDLKALEGASCECYRMIRDECDRLGVFSV